MATFPFFLINDTAWQTSLNAAQAMPVEALATEVIAALSHSAGFSMPQGGVYGSATAANADALDWLARQRPGATLVAHERLPSELVRHCEVLGLQLALLPVTKSGTLSLRALVELAEHTPVDVVIAQLGHGGAVDPLAQLIRLSQKYGFRIHGDASTASLFHVAMDNDAALEDFRWLRYADTLVLSPFAGMPPQTESVLLTSDPSVFETLPTLPRECCETLWALLRVLPPVTEGPIATHLDRCRAAAQQLRNGLAKAYPGLPQGVPVLDTVRIRTAATPGAGWHPTGAPHTWHWLGRDYRDPHAAAEAALIEATAALAG